MRIKKVQLAGLAVALVGATAGAAQAEDVTISAATTTPLSTSDPVAAAPVSAGDITIASGGRITITAGQTAITVDSSNDVTIASGGSISAEDRNNVTGILIEGGNTGAISNSGSITLLENYTPADLPGDTDDEPDQPFATGQSRTGIWLQSGPAFIGDIINAGTITIEGNNSYGIRVDSVLDNGGSLTGSLNHTGAINLTGANSAAIAITGTGAIAGDLRARGTISVRGENSVGLLVDGQIDGALRINGTWAVTGYRSNVRPADTSNLDPDDLLQGGSVVHVRDNVLGGITVEGIGAEDDPDDDGDGVIDSGTNADTDDDFTAGLAVYGEAPAIHIEADPSGALTVGANSAGFGLQIRGSVAASGVYDNVDATGIFIEGASGAATATINGGIAIDHTVSATAIEGNAYGLRIGDFASTPRIAVRGTLSATSVSDDPMANAYAIRIEDGADVEEITNNGTIRARVLGEQGTATAIFDDTSSIQRIYNSGSIIAELAQTDDDVSDDTPPPPITGAAVAIDLRDSAQNLVLRQYDQYPATDAGFPDDDAANDVPDPAIRILGDIYLGSGNDLVSLEAGEIIGDLSFGAGDDDFLIDNGATFRGSIANAGVLDITVTDGALYHGGGTTNLTTAYFDQDATLGIVLSETAGASTHFIASGIIEFVDGSVIVPTLPIGLPDSSAPGEFIFLTALGGLVGEEHVVGSVTGEGVPYLYNLDIAVASGDPNSLEAIYDMKTASELGLTSNQAAAFTALIDALRLDDAASSAFSNLLSADDFFDAYADLMPSYSSAAAEVATTAIQQMQGATSNRLAATRLQGLDEVSIWAQEIGYAINRTPPTANGQEFDGTGFGMAVGIDGPLNSGGLFGLSASFIASEVEEAGRPEGEISTWFGQLNAYLGAASGPIDLDFIAGLGAGKMQSRRFVEIGDDFSALAEADWWAFEGHAAARASAPMRLADWFIVTPQAGLTYVAMSEQAYTEEGGGDAIDYDVDDAFSQRLWADAGVEFSGRFSLGGNNIIAPRLFVGYRGNLIDEEAERTVRFVSGGSDFTLIDEGLGDGGPIVGLGFDATNGYSTISLGYEGEFGDQIERHSVNAAIRFRF